VHVLISARILITLADSFDAHITVSFNEKLSDTSMIISDYVSFNWNYTRHVQDFLKTCRKSISVAKKLEV